MKRRSTWIGGLTVIALALPTLAWAEGKGADQRTKQQGSDASAGQQTDASVQQKDSAQQESAQQQQRGQSATGQQQGTETSGASAQAGGAQQGMGQELYALSNQQVQDLQRQLQQRGHYDGKIDGIPGPQTRAAVRDFQKQSQQGAGAGLDETLAALGIESSAERQNVSGQDTSSSGQGQSMASERQNVSGSMDTVQLSSLGSQQVRDLQTQLQEQGHYQGSVDGIVGPQTQSALQRYFKQQAELAAQGQLGEAAQELFGIEPNQFERTSGREGGTSARDSTKQQGASPATDSSGQEGASQKKNMQSSGSQQSNQAGQRGQSGSAR